MGDEQEKQKIRELINNWIEASRAGDIDKVLTLMAEDVVFLQPGQKPMRGRETFAARSRAPAGKVKFEGKPEVQEIQVFGNLAYCWNYLSVSITPEGGPAKQLAGNILSIFRKKPDGQWELYRDANMLAPI
jgi:uncharacterized protein (TIGR02246 family)